MKQNWEYKKLGEVAMIEYGTRVVQKKDGGSIYPVYGGGGATFKMDTFNREDRMVIARFAMSKQCTRIVKGKFFLNDSGLTVATSSSLLSQLYLDRCLMSMNDKIYSLGNGAAQKNLDMKAFVRLVIPVPPLSTQTAIVSELDALSAIIADHKSLLKKYDELEQSIFYHMFGDPVKNDKGWVVKKLGEVCTKVTDGTHSSPLNFEFGDRMYVTAKNIKKDGIILKGITYISEEDHKAIYERCNPVFGDVLYIKDGATTGIATINTLQEEFSLLSSVALLKVGDLLNNQYLKFILNMPSLYEYIRVNMGGAAITRLTIAKIKDIKIPLPPLPLQQEFASKIEAIEAMKADTKKSLAKSEELFNARMDYYFNA